MIGTNNLHTVLVPIIGHSPDPEEAPELLTRVHGQRPIGKLYPPNLLPAEIDSDHPQRLRGLIVDKQEGNLLKLDRHGYVGRAFHGHRRMAGAERTAMYSAQRIGQDPERFAWADTLFALPEITIFAKVVDLIDSAPERFVQRSVPTYGEAWNDVRAAIDLAHQDDSIKRRLSSAREITSRMIRTSRRRSTSCALLERSCFC